VYILQTFEYFGLLITAALFFNYTPVNIAVYIYTYIYIIYYNKYL